MGSRVPITEKGPRGASPRASVSLKMKNSTTTCPAAKLYPLLEWKRMGRMCCEVGGFHDQEKRGILPPFPQPAKAGKLSPPDEVRFLFLLSFSQPHTGTSARNWTHKRAGHCEYPQIRGPPSHIILRRKGGEQATRRKTATRETEAKPIWTEYARYFDR